MAKTPEQVNKEVGDCSAPMTARANDVPKYPWGLCINLEKEQIDALGIDGECEVGDMIHLRAMAEVTSCSERKTEGGTDCRIELQITHLACENEDEENETGDAEENRQTRAKRRYSGEERMGDGLIDQNESGGELMGDQPLIAKRNYGGASGGKSTTKAVSDPGEAHLGKKNYKAA